MKKIETPISDLYLLEPTVYGDDRGEFFETFNADVLSKLGISFHVRQSNQSSSKRGVLRGIHFQHPPKAMAKLVRCTSGSLWDVAVDLRPASPTYKQWFGVELSAENKRMLLVPEGFGHGFYALEDCTMQYLCSNTYDRELDANIRWDDPEIGIEWPIIPLLSDRDEKAPALKDVKLRF